MKISNMPKKKPLVSHDYTPEILIGVGNMELLKEHFKIASKVYSPERYESAMKPFTIEDREFIGEIYQKLADYGFHPRGMSSSGEILFGTALRGDVQDMIETKYPLRCDTCNCPEGKCQSYSREEINRFKALANGQSPISNWPDKIFDKQEIPF